MRLVVEADGGSRGNPGPAAFGALVRDAGTGDVLAEAAETIGTTTNNVAEYRGLLAGLQLAAGLDPDAEVEVRMDSKLVVEQMAGRWKIKHPDLKPLASQAARVFPRGITRWTWIPRELNKRADTLVNAALDGKLERVLRHPATPSPRDTGVPAVPVGHAVAVGGAVPVIDSADVDGSARVLTAPPVAEQDALLPAVQPRQEASRPVAPRPDPQRQSRTSLTVTLLFLRHGRTADNVARRFSGPHGADPGLDDVGRHQAAVVAAALGDARVDAVVSSPLRRARETAEVIASALGLGVVVDPALADFDPGGWDGHTTDEVRATSPAWHAAWSVSPDVAPPDGESVRAVQARVLGGVRALVEKYTGRRVLLVSHAVPIGAAVTAALEAPLASALRLQIANGSLSVVRYPADGPPRTEAVALPAGTVLPT